MRYEQGRVVKSIAGHDQGKFFVVLSSDERFALIADGKERKLAKPKRKNLKHLADMDTHIIVTGLTDKKLRTALHGFNYREDNIAEESDKLV